MKSILGKKRVIFDISGVLSTIIYFIGLCLLSAFILFDDQENIFKISDVMPLLILLLFISIIAIISIMLSKHRYFITALLTALFSIFFILSAVNMGGDFIKMSIYCIILNVLIFCSTFYRIKKGTN